MPLAAITWQQRLHYSAAEQQHWRQPQWHQPPCWRQHRSPSTLVIASLVVPSIASAAFISVTAALSAAAVSALLPQQRGQESSSNHRKSNDLTHINKLPSERSGRLCALNTQIGVDIIDIFCVRAQRRFFSPRSRSSESGPKFRCNALSRSAIPASMPRRGSSTGNSGRPHGTIPAKWKGPVKHFDAEAVKADPATHPHPDRADFPSAPLSSVQIPRPTFNARPQHSSPAHRVPSSSACTRRRTSAPCWRG